MQKGAPCKCNPWIGSRVLNTHEQKGAPTAPHEFVDWCNPTTAEGCNAWMSRLMQSMHCRSLQCRNEQMVAIHALQKCETHYALQKQKHAMHEWADGCNPCIGEACNPSTNTTETVCNMIRWFDTMYFCCQEVNSQFQQQREADDGHGRQRHREGCHPRLQLEPERHEETCREWHQQYNPPRILWAQYSFNMSRTNGMKCYLVHSLTYLPLSPLSLSLSLSLSFSLFCPWFKSKWESISYEAQSTS